MWDDFVAWFQSPGGARVLQTAIIPALAILVAGVLAAVIARAAVRATLRRADRVEAASVVAVLVAAARTIADTGDDAARRRASRLRSEADVRVRLLPLPGASLAADWASARIDAMQPGSESAITELRDGLVAWVSRPARARRLFPATAAPAKRPEAPAPAAPAAAPAPPVATASEPVPEPERQTAAQPAAALPTAPDPAPGAASTEADDQGRFARPGPLRTPAEREPVPAPAPAPAPEPVEAAASAEALPAWQRTRAVERLQQERGRTRGVEAPTSDERADPGTAPVLLQHTHRAPEAPPSEADAVRLEAHQQAKHARPEDEPTSGAVAAPAWLDQYDDEAQVTQNLDLKTPPPVSASAVRDRGPGEDLVPRS